MKRTYVLVVDALASGNPTLRSWYGNGKIRLRDDSMLDELVESGIESSAHLDTWLSNRLGPSPTRAGEEHFGLLELVRWIDDFFVIYTEDGRIDWVEQLRVAQRDTVSWGRHPTVERPDVTDA